MRENGELRLGIGMRTVIAVVLTVVCGATCPGEASLEIIKSFGYPEHSARRPGPKLIEGSDGMLYGVTLFGGGSPASPFYRSAGTVFRLSKDGKSYAVLHHFNGVDGANPSERLIEASDGRLYGTTSSGDGINRGTVFRLEKDGSQFEVIHYFSGDDGRGPVYGVTEGTDGMLYGRTFYGGEPDEGVVFRLAKDGTDYQILYNFQASFAEPGPMVFGSDNHVYGTANGGSFGLGVIFRISQDGNFEVIYTFRSLSCYYPRLSCEISDGGLFGVGHTSDGTNAGCIFTLNKDGTGFSIVKSFAREGSDGTGPTGVSEGGDGYLYGTTSGGGPLTKHIAASDRAGTVFRMGKQGQDFSVLHQFDHSKLEGATPGSPVIQGRDGDLYGTTISGVGFPGGLGNGVVYRLKPKGGQFRVLHFFNGMAGDGAEPTKVIEGIDGLLYGTTRYGGGSNSVGTIFRMNKDGSGYDFVLEFPGPTGNNGAPVRQLLYGQDGLLYWVTPYRVFRIRRDGKKLQVLHDFDPSTDGLGVEALIEGPEAFYGITSVGVPFGDGTVFRLTKDGSQYVVLHRQKQFYPRSLLPGTDGYLYGITYRALFKLRMDGSDYQIVHTFGILEGDGTEPGALIQASDGILYGATVRGGPNGFGTIFRINPDGSSFTTLFTFDKVGAVTDLVEASDGTLYGTVFSSPEGILHGGRVFRINKDGSNYAVVREFAKGERGPEGPAGIIEGSDGILYITTQHGGQMNVGTVSRILSIP